MNKWNRNGVWHDPLPASCRGAVTPLSRAPEKLRLQNPPAREHISLWYDAETRQCDEKLLECKKKLQLGGAVRGGSWSFAFLKKLRQCCSFRGNYANSGAYKLVFVHENCLEFVASHIFPSQAESFLFLLLAFFSDSLREGSLWWCFTVLLVSTAGPDLLSQPCLGVYATIDLLNLIVIMLHLFAAFKHCCTVLYSKPCGPILHCKVCLQPGWESCAPKLSSSVLQRNQSVLPEQAASEALLLCFLCERNHRLRRPYWKSGKGQKWMWTGFGNKNFSREKLAERGRKISQVHWF